MNELHSVADDATVSSMSTTTVPTTTIQTVCDQVAEVCMINYCNVGGWDAPAIHTDTIDGVTVTAEVEGDPDGNYVSFTAWVDGEVVATGSVVGSIFNFFETV